MWTLCGVILLFHIAVSLQATESENPNPSCARLSVDRVIKRKGCCRVPENALLHQHQLTVP